MPVSSMAMRKSAQEHVRVGLQAHLKPLWRFAFALSKRADTADDLVQSTCLRALDKSHQVDPDRPLLPWLITICRSIWLSELRAQAIRKTQAISVTPEIDLIATGTEIETNILSRQVYSLVMDLPEAQRSVAMLVFVEGFSYTQTAEALDIPIGTVMSRLHAVRSKMRSIVEHET